MKVKTNIGDLDIPINSTSLQEYMHNKLSYLDESKVQRIIGLSIKIISEIQNYGLTTLAQLDAIIPKNLFKNYKKIGAGVTALAVLRDILIINDPKKYFTKSYSGDWGLNPHDENDF